MYPFFATSNLGGADAEIKNQVTPIVIQNGFRKYGLHPWNSEEVEGYLKDTVKIGIGKSKERDISDNKDRADMNLSFFESFVINDTLKEFQNQLNKNQ
ncbi:hypothetical protein HHI36_011960 [Cryptolaemus montrouzieri]|uniref:Uncharacterized protein n=1 Tax=Cryptolaemus montrouzieri TaxID=559131 RepID=A0ABD2NCV5_9CUCU